MSRPVSARHRILDAAVKLVRTKGFTATTVDELCAAAASPRAPSSITSTARRRWASRPRGTGRRSPARCSPGAHITSPPIRWSGCWPTSAIRRDILQGELPEFTCLVGTMAQETHQTSRAIAEACHASMSGHAATLEPDIAAAMRERGLGPRRRGRLERAEPRPPHAGGAAGRLHPRKGRGRPERARDSVDHLDRYVRLLSQPRRPPGARHDRTRRAPRTRPDADHRGVASRALRCWTEPELMKRWFTPRPWTTPVIEVDLRPGGANYILMRGPMARVFPIAASIWRSFRASDRVHRRLHQRLGAFRQAVLHRDDHLRDIGQGRTRYTPAHCTGARAERERTRRWASTTAG